MKTFDIYALGHALVDETYAVDEQFLSQKNLVKGHRKLIDHAAKDALLASLSNHSLIDRSSGGSGANSVVAASEMGASSFFSCKVGKDESGQFFLDSMHGANVETPFLTPQHQGDTGLCIVLVTNDAERTMNTFTGITDDVGEDVINYESLAHSKLLYMESYLVTTSSAQAGALNAIETAKKNQVEIAINFSDPAIVQHFRPQLELWMEKELDLLFCNEEEAVIWGNGDLAEGIKKLRAQVKTLVVTKGAEGSTIFCQDESISIAPYKVNAINTTGAGDIFAGGFIYAYTQDYPLAVCGDLASYVSSLLVQQNNPRLTAQELRKARDKVLKP